MFDLRIYTFLTLYKELNYSRTAEVLNMTQPGVSLHIRKIEEYYKVKLFNYEGRVLTPTKEAEILKRHIDAMLVEEKALKEELISSKTLHLRVGATKTIGEFVLVPYVKRFLKDKSHTLDYTIDNTENLLNMIEDGKIDFAVIEGVIDKSRYGYSLFKKEKFVGICSVNHPFANKYVKLSDIFNEPLLLREKGSGTRFLFEQELKMKGYNLSLFSRVTSLGNFNVIMEILEAGNAITFAYKPIAEQRSDLTTFTVEDFDIEGEFNFVYMNEKIASKKIEQFFKD